jgi:hypothetical protein
MDLQVVEEKGVSWAPKDFEQAMKFANMVANTSFAPTTYRGKPEECLMAMMAGNEVGLGAMASMQNIAVINGHPTFYGDAAFALVKASNDFEKLEEHLTDNDKTAVCIAKRKGESEVKRTFTMQDAQTAGLLDKAGPWKTYPKRMLQMRARAWAIRDVWPHVLKGLSVREEMADLAPEKNVTPDYVEPVKENPIEVQRERLQIILEEAEQSGKVSIEDAKTTTDNSLKYTTLEVLTKFVDKVESSINDVIE